MPSHAPGLQRQPGARLLSISPKARRRYSFRPFIATIATVLLIYSWTYASRNIFPIRTEPFDYLDDKVLLVRRTPASPPPQLECRDVIHAHDKCGFVQSNCADENSGLIPYLTLYYCASPFIEPVSFAILICWLALLFTTIGIAASDFFSVNLATISSLLGLSQSLAGVTFLAFGNGSPDVFSTFAAMGSGSASMAVGELIGAAAFITAVVAGSMALVTEFKVARKTFVRDICFFIVAILFTMYFLFDGKLLYWECWAMIVYYAVYVVTVVTWHWYEKRQAALRARLKQADRSQQVGYFEPYTDNPSAHDSGGSSVAVASPSLNPSSPVTTDPTTPLLEAGFYRHRTGEESEDKDDLDSLVAAEISNNMRIIRTPGRRRRNTGATPIRPSLVGALEFRSDLKRVKKELEPLPHVHLPKAPPRRPNSHQRCWSATDLEGMFTEPSSTRSHSPSPLTQTPLVSPMLAPLGGRPGSRERALSSGDFPSGNDLPMLVPPPAAHESTDDMRQLLLNKVITRQPSPERHKMHSRSASTSSFHSFKVDGNLAPPPAFQQQPSLGIPVLGGPSGSPRKTLTPSVLPKLHIPSPLAQAITVPVAGSPLSPFPRLSLSPGGISPGDIGSPTIMEEPEEDDSRQPLLQQLAPHPIPTFNIEAASDHVDITTDKETVFHSWWPELFPTPYSLSCALFPTLQNWSNKGHWDRFVSIMTAPSVLLLVLTLPVADGEVLDCDSDESVYSLPIQTPAPSVQPVPNTIMAPHSLSLVDPPNSENEWQRYRRYSKSHHHRTSSVASAQVSTPILIAVESPTNTRCDIHIPTLITATAVDNGVGVDPAALSVKVLEAQEAAELGWSRWLVGVQIFTGPAFFLGVVWANMLDELDDPTWKLEQLLGMGLLFSGVVFGVFVMATEHERRPKYHSLLCFMGFLVSIAWISTIAGEVVGVLKAVGVIMDISEALLGLTVFAAGNSLGDLVADITIARLGYPVMALAACFGGPMLNILLGIGVGGVMMMYREAHHLHQHHPDSAIKYQSFKVEVGGALLISAVGLLVTLVGLLVVVPANGWVLSRRIGWGLILFWGIVTMVNVLLDLGGYLR